MLEVTKETFEPEVLQAEGYVFVDFFGDGCVPCAALMRDGRSGSVRKRERVWSGPHDVD